MTLAAFIAVLCAATLVVLYSRARTSRDVALLIDHKFSGMRTELSEFRTLDRQARVLGLAEAERSICDFDYEDAFDGARSLTIVMNDASSWLQDNLPWIATRAAAGLRLQFMLVHPDSAYVPLLAHKQSLRAEDLQAKIRGSVARISHELGDRAEIWGHTLPSSYALVMSDSKAVYMPYPASRERGRMPAFVFTTGSTDGFFEQLQRDVEALRVDCRPVADGSSGSEHVSESDLVPSDFRWELKEPAVKAPSRFPRPQARGR